tara:strand:+ start:430 stop:672 length:243 start_codon:yes stop_codon:yes gene_type:complete
MKKPIKLTSSILKRIILEERKKLSEQAEKIKEAKRNKKLRELKREVRAFLHLKREQKVLIERLKKIGKRTRTIKRKIKGD